VTNVAPVDKATNNDMAYCSSVILPEMVPIISRSNAKVILCSNSLIKPLFRGGAKTIGNSLMRTIAERKQCLIFVENPRLVIMKLLNEIHYFPRADKKSRNHQSETAILGSSPVVIISKSAKIGKNSSIGNFTKIGDKCIIGDNTVVGDCVIIEQNTRIGKNCIIKPGTVIGADGFAYERLEGTLELQRFPHIGGVAIGNNVEICSNCSIARGSLSDTIIGDGTKLDALVHVAHNVEIGRHCALTAGTIIGGSTRIGDMCWTGLNSTIKHKVRIGNKVIVGSGASVINDIDDEDIVAGVPAKSIKHKVTSNQLFLMAGQLQKSIKEVQDKNAPTGKLASTVS
jgi:UDP-3-O-[3-hydroxymyristoyl] glucosamine N-acyltransferase